MSSYMQWICEKSSLNAPESPIVPTTTSATVVAKSVVESARQNGDPLNDMVEPGEVSCSHARFFFASYAEHKMSPRAFGFNRQNQFELTNSVAKTPESTGNRIRSVGTFSSPDRSAKYPNMATHVHRFTKAVENQSLTKLLPMPSVFQFLKRG